MIQAEGSLWIPERHPGVGRVPGGRGSDTGTARQSPEGQRASVGPERHGQRSSGTVDSLKAGLCSRAPAGYLGSNPKSASSKSPALVSTSVNGVHSNIHRTVDVHRDNLGSDTPVSTCHPGEH